VGEGHLHAYREEEPAVVLRLAPDRLPTADGPDVSPEGEARAGLSAPPGPVRARRRRVDDQRSVDVLRGRRGGERGGGDEEAADVGALGPEAIREAPEDLA